MKAALLYGKRDLRIEECPSPPLEAHGLRIKVRASGICGSDTRMFFTGPTPRYALPIILGHEFSGEVLAIGEHTDGYAPGDLVTVAPLIPCLRCEPCSRGQDQLCEQAQVIGCTVPGGLAETVTLPSQMVLAGGVVKVPAGVDPGTAALSELVGCCLHGMGMLGMGPGARILIVGDGPIGLTFLQLARLVGAGTVITTGRRPARQALSLELGADEALDATSLKLKDRFGQAFDSVIVAASSPEVTEEAIELVRPGGHLLVFSGYAYGTSISLDLNAIHYRELHLHGSIDCTIKDFRKAVRILPQLRMDKLITGSFGLDQAVDAFEATREQDTVKTLVEP